MKNLLTCDLIAQIDKFLSEEINYEKRLASKRIRTQAYVLRSLKIEDFYYALLQPNAQLLGFADGTWVEINQRRHTQYGSIWLTEESRPYLLIREHISPGYIQIVEADSIQLLEMQKQAFSKLQMKSNAQAQKISDTISGKYISRRENLLQIDFHDKRILKVKSQALAVRKALWASQKDAFFLIHGPPGTGKTTVITEIVRHLVDMDQKVLITSHTNVAVNNVMENLLPHFKSKMVRLGPKFKVSKILKDLVPTTHDELIRVVVSQIVGATLSKLSILVLNGNLSFDVPYFDTVIIDESSMATIPLTLAGILLGKTFILVGDHLQLPPITKTPLPPSCHRAEKCRRKCESLFRLLIELYPKKSQMLTMQFRSNPVIMGFSARYIYEGKIESSRECFEKNLELQKKPDHEQIRGTINEKPISHVNMHYDENPIEWYPSFFEAKRRRIKQSCFNRLEAAVAIKIRYDLIKAGVPPERIWIITPFRLQREIIRRAIRQIYGTVPKHTVISLDENLTASTVDSIQGKENDVVIYSLTWVPSEGRERSVHKLLRDIRRLNVAMTRARKKLIVIGDLTKLSWQYPYGPLKTYMENQKAVAWAPKINDEDNFLAIIEYCYSKRRKAEVTKELREKARKATKRLREELPRVLTKPTVWKITNETEFRDFQESLWGDLRLADKKKIYDLRIRGCPIEIRVVYDQETKQKAIHISEISHENFQVKPQAPQEQKVRPPTEQKYAPKPHLPSLISLQDFQEFGKVKRYLQFNPEADDKEIARQTKLTIDRVVVLRALIIHELGTSQQDKNLRTE